ncbi:uncharacterized protein DAT39_011035 [Clarias magur]|uniref:Uncharacterized protein n=1 Tax=Clarias magur TaxID=1594786 RepID=A0A8J4TPX3_CLAMG|nr:uncharacterized protein DAT39_011035 [Clarias magur]
MDFFTHVASGTRSQPVEQDRLRHAVVTAHPDIYCRLTGGPSGIPPFEFHLTPSFSICLLRSEDSRTLLHIVHLFSQVLFLKHPRPDRARLGGSCTVRSCECFIKRALRVM